MRARTTFESTYLLSIGIDIVNRDTKDEETHQGRHTNKTYPNISLRRVKKDDETSEEESKGNVNDSIDAVPVRKASSYWKMAWT